MQGIRVDSAYIGRGLSCFTYIGMRAEGHAAQSLPIKAIKAIYYVGIRVKASMSMSIGRALEDITSQSISI